MDPLLNDIIPGLDDFLPSNVDGLFAIYDSLGCPSSKLELQSTPMDIQDNFSAESSFKRVVSFPSLVPDVESADMSPFASQLAQRPPQEEPYQQNWMNAAGCLSMDTSWCPGQGAYATLYSGSFPIPSNIHTHGESLAKQPAKPPKIMFPVPNCGPQGRAPVCAPLSLDTATSATVNKPSGRRSSKSTRANSAPPSPVSAEDERSSTNIDVAKPSFNSAEIARTRSGRVSGPKGVTAPTRDRAAFEIQAQNMALPSVTNNANGSDSDLNKPKRRFMWTEDLHRAFIAAIFDYGLQSVTPKLLFDSMQDIGPAGMTSDHIKSHLQKYRKNSKMSKDRFMRDFQRAQKEAHLRAVEVEARTGVAPFPVQFSTYPISMPLTRQSEPIESLMAEEEARLARRCDSCKERDELMELGVGMYERPTPADPEFPQGADPAASTSLPAVQLGRLGDETQHQPIEPIAVDENADAVELAIKLLTAAHEAPGISNHAATVATGDFPDSPEAYALAEKQETIDRRMQTQMKIHRTILSKQGDHMGKLGGDSVSSPECAALVPLPKSLHRNGIALPGVEASAVEPTSDDTSRAYINELLADIFDLEPADDLPSDGNNRGGSGIPDPGLLQPLAVQRRMARPDALFSFLRSPAHHL